MDTPAGWRLWFAALRPFAYPASALPVLVGTAAAAPMREWRWGVLAAELGLVTLLHSVGNLLNDYFDFRSGVDRRLDEDEGRPGRFLVKGILSPGQVLRFAILCGAAALPLAAFLVRLGGPPAALIGAIGLLGAYAYTGKPFQLKYRGMGELCIFITFGPAIFAGAAWMQAGRLDAPALALSAPLGMLVVSILAANNLRDYEEDAAGGARTLARRVGRRAYLAFFLTMLFGPAALVAAGAACGMVSAWALPGLLALPLGVSPARDAVAGQRRPDADAVAARHMTAFGALTFLGLLIGGPRP